MSPFQGMTGIFILFFREDSSRNDCFWKRQYRGKVVRYLKRTVMVNRLNCQEYKHVQMLLDKLEFLVPSCGQSNFVVEEFWQADDNFQDAGGPR